jgi:hypothetical protein
MSPAPRTPDIRQEIGQVAAICKHLKRPARKKEPAASGMTAFSASAAGEVDLRSILDGIDRSC